LVSEFSIHYRFTDRGFLTPSPNWSFRYLSPWAFVLLIVGMALFCSIEVLEVCIVAVE
jgi:hypothetical protein